MKLLYFFLSIMSLVLTGYLVMNNFTFDHPAFSSFLINGLFVVLPGSLIIAALIALFSLKRKHQDKDMMTKRQYYNYRSAR